MPRTPWPGPASDALEYKPASYDQVRTAIGKAEALNQEEYKDFSGVEAAVTAQGRDMRELDVSQLMALWNREKHPENEERKGNHHEQD